MLFHRCEAIKNTENGNGFREVMADTWRWILMGASGDREEKGGAMTGLTGNTDESNSILCILSGKVLVCVLFLF